MNKAYSSIALLLLAAASLSAQDWRAQLKSDAVVIRSGKMIYDEVGLYKIKVAGYEPAQVQVKRRQRRSGTNEWPGFKVSRLQSFKVHIVIETLKRLKL